MCRNHLHAEGKYSLKTLMWTSKNCLQLNQHIIVVTFARKTVNVRVTVVILFSLSDSSQISKRVQLIVFLEE